MTPAEIALATEQWQAHWSTSHLSAKQETLNLSREESTLPVILYEQDIDRLESTLQQYQYAIIVADCLQTLPKLPKIFKTAILDPPYNIKYKYNSYIDDLDWEQYINWQVSCINQTMESLLDDGTLFYINYPEAIAEMYQTIKDKHHIRDIIAWVYHGHNASMVTGLRRSFRLILWLCKDTTVDYCFYGNYRTPEDKRIKRKIAAGQKPIELDWWLIEQVKNVSKEKTCHPCQIPEQLLKKIITAVTEKKVLSP